MQNVQRLEIKRLRQRLCPSHSPYTHRYLHELGTGRGVDAVHATHGSVGFAIQYTTLTIILGFSLLAFSDFVPSALFGLLTGLAMAMSFAYNLTMLPVLLNRFVAGRRAC